MSTADLTARYAAPTASVAVEPFRTHLWKRSVLLMIGLTLVTLSFYLSFWYLRRWRAFNELQSRRKISPWPAYAQLTLFTADVVAAVVRDFAGVALPTGGPFEVAVRITVWLWMLYEIFGIRRILIDHLRHRDSLAGEARFYRDPPSVLGTFFFSEFYLQYLINRDIVDARA